MDFLIALVVCLLIGFAAGTIVRIRFRMSSFASIHRNVTAAVSILLYSFFLFAKLGLNPWSVILIPLISLLVVLLLVRDAISKLLEIH